MIIGVTGGIASGKSEVCRILEQNGFVHIDADEVAHDVLEIPEVIGQITEVFGNEILDAKDDERGPLFIDRKKLGKIVFADNDKMSILENITHPQIIRQIQGIINRADNKNFVIEAIELVSSGLVNICDVLWVVHAEPEQQIHRLMTYRNMSYDDAMARLKTQEVHDWDEETADCVIYSTEPLETMRSQVEDALQALLDS